MIFIIIILLSRISNPVISNILVFEVFDAELRLVQRVFPRRHLFSCVSAWRYDGLGFPFKQTGYKSILAFPRQLVPHRSSLLSTILVSLCSPA